MGPVAAEGIRLRHRVGGYREYNPAGAAQAFCEAFWTHETPPDSAVDGAHRVLPDPAVSVAFWCLGRDDSGVPATSGVILIGAKTRPHLFPLTPGLELAAVRLKLEWVGPILGIDPGAFDDQICDLSVVRRLIAGRLHAELRQTRSPGAALPILARTVIESRASPASPPPAAAAALDIVRRTAGRMPCERVAETLGVSTRTLLRQVHDSAGLSTKTYSRMLRLVHSMEAADRSAAPNWAAIAVACGYCDRSHLIRECLSLTGIAPTRLHRERELQRVAERSNPA